jgi:hypothetical protein
MTLKPKQSDAAEREPDEEPRGRQGPRPPPKVTLARVHFLERPLPDWWNEPQPPRPRRKGR